MGAWGTGIFDDDSALDILDELEEVEDIKEFMLESINDALDMEYLEYQDCFKVLVLSALIDLSLHKTKYDLLTEEYPDVLKLVKKQKLESLKTKAIEGLKVVISNKSELNELWEEVEEYHVWKNNIDQMIIRLSK